MPERNTVILLVDDNAALVDNLAEVLSDVGYTVKQAGSCAAARILAQSGFAVALVDLRLPDGDGTMLARELKESRRDSQVILLTGHASTESAAAAVRVGAFAYLVKPTPPHDLLLTVAQAVQKVRLVAEGRELTRRAHHAEKLAAVGALSAGLSHEIKNPLNAATLQLSVLERRLKRIGNLPPDIFEPLAIVQAEIKRLASFLDDFLQFSRPRELQRTPLDGADLVRCVAGLLEPEAQAAQLRLEVACDGDTPLVADAARLQQTLVNLVLNAIQAAPPGGWVRMSCKALGKSVQFVVEDSGPGIPEEVRERIFEPFFTTKESGSGLGLPLVHSTVQQHGGTLTVDREAAGARFVISLPAA